MLCLLLLPLPAVADFALHEVKSWPSHNVIRLLTGGGIGFALGSACLALATDHILVGATILGWLAVLEFLAAALLQRAGLLDGFVRRYADGARKTTGAVAVLPHRRQQ